MKIGLLTHSVLPRGGVVHVLELGHALHARGHDVTIFAPAAPGQMMFRGTPCRLALAPLSPNAGDDFAGRIRRRIDAMRDYLHSYPGLHSFDVLHAHDGIGANASADLVQAGALRGYVRTAHHVDRYSDPRVQAWEERSIRAATRVFCVSAMWQTRLLEQFGVLADRVTNGIDLDRFTPHVDGHDAPMQSFLGPRRPRVLAVGGIEARKNSTRLLQAFARLRNTYPDAQLVIAGGASLLPHDTELVAFRAAAEAAGLALGADAPVFVTGPLPDAVMPALYRAADVVAMPSLLEGFGLAPLEGLACGTPAVVSAQPPFTEHFARADVEWADALDVASITAALERGIGRGRHDAVPPVCARFGWGPSAARHLALYQAFIDATAVAVTTQGVPHARDALPAALAR